MIKGDIVLVPFPFTDLSSNKNRPALVLINNEMDITVTFISTRIKWKEETDILLIPSKKNGLKKESLVRLTKIATIDKELVIGLIGTIDADTVNLLNQNLKKILKLE